MCTLYLRPIRSVDALHTLYLRLSTRYDAILIQAFCSTNLRHSDDLSAIYPRKCATSADQGSILADLYTYELQHTLDQYDLACDIYVLASLLRSIIDAF